MTSPSQAVITRSRFVAEWLEALEVPVTHPFHDAAGVTEAGRVRIHVSEEESCDAGHQQRQVVYLVDSEHEDGLRDGEEPGIRFEIRGLRDVLKMVLSLGQRLGVLEKAMDVLGEGERMLARSYRRNTEASPLRVAALTNFEPVVIGGMWIPDMVARAGGVPLGEATAGIEVDVGEIVALDPDVLVIIANGESPARSRERLKGKATTAGWNELRALERGNVFFFDGNQHFTHPGPGVFKTILELRSILDRIQ